MPEKEICDGNVACEDGSDELYAFCLNWTCSEGFVKCRNDDSRCVPR